jgi:hypothetical protein
LRTDRARVAVFVGHHVDFLKTDVMKQLRDRFGLITTQLQQ